MNANDKVTYKMPTPTPAKYWRPRPELNRGTRFCRPLWGVADISRTCPNVPLSNCPCLSSVAAGKHAIIGLFRPFPSLVWTRCGFSGLKIMLCSAG